MRIRSLIPLTGLILGLAFTNSACNVNRPRETPIVSVVRNHAEMVVNIRTETIVDLKEHPYWGDYGEQIDRFFKEYYGENYSEGTLKYKTVGSGVILDQTGLIVTNAHVIQKATTIYVVLEDGTILPASIQVVSQVDDLALIKTDLPSPVEEVRFAHINDVMIGETVIAIGSPLGFENSVTVGVISGKDRAFSNTQCQYVCSGLLQTDAPINPGNSGGALFNLDGELLGVNLAVVQNAQNIGFAIPVSRVEDLLVRFKKE
jgi:serine protease Do